MRVTDRFVIKDKAAELKMRKLEEAIDQLTRSHKMGKAEFVEIESTILELFISVFKRLDDNTTPAKTLLDITREEVNDACFRVGPADVFLHDSEYVIAVLQELTK